MCSKTWKICYTASLAVVVAFAAIWATGAASSKKDPASAACPCKCGCLKSGVRDAKKGIDCPCKCGCAKSGVCTCARRLPPPAPANAVAAKAAPVIVPRRASIAPATAAAQKAASAIAARRLPPAAASLVAETAAPVSAARTAPRVSVAAARRPTAVTLPRARPS